MIYLSQLKDHLMAVFRLMTETNMEYVDVSYRGRLYRLHVEDMQQETVQRRRPRKADLSSNIESKKCPTCKRALMINGVCMSSMCPTNTKALLHR